MPSGGPCDASNPRRHVARSRRRRSRPWTAVDRPDLAGYRLWKGDREHRPHVVYKGQDTSFVDTDVAAGHRYGYLVQALNADGRPIGWTRISVAGVPPAPPPAPEPTAIEPPAPAAVPAVEHPVKPVEVHHGESDDDESPAPLPQPGSLASPPAPLAQDKPAHPPVEHPKPGPRPAERPVEHLSLACEPVKDAAGQATVACIVAVDKNRRPLAQSPAAQPQAVRSQQKTTSH